jgi:hypothetical protein
MWTTPRTYVAGEVLTAAILNVDHRDNLVALRAQVDGAALEVSNWTPNLTGSGGGGPASYSTRNGWVYKQGRQRVVVFGLELTALNGLEGQVYMEGLAGAHAAAGSGPQLWTGTPIFYRNLGDTWTSLSVVINSGQTACYFAGRIGIDDDTEELTFAHLTDTSQLYGTIAYYSN